MLKNAWIFLVVYLVTLVDKHYSSNLILPTFSWDPRNEIFKGGLCGGNENYAHISVQEESEIYFLCPSAVIIGSIQRSFTSRVNMYENMFLVTKDEFDRCQVDGITQHTKKVMVCDTPKDSSKIKYRRFFFSSHTTSAGIPFFANTTYYFIATSNGTISGLDNRRDGRCKSHNMRLAVTICGRDQNCVQNDHLCKVPKKLVPAVTTTTSTIETTLSKPTTTEGHIPIGTPKSAPKKGNGPADDTESRSGDGFGSKEIICIFGGLIVGFIIGIVVMFFMRKRNWPNGLKVPKLFVTGDNSDKGSEARSSPDSVGMDLPKKFHEDNPSYRHSTEVKRLLSTSSNSSSERYSVIPPVAARTTPPPGTVAV